MIEQLNAVVSDSFSAAPSTTKPIVISEPVQFSTRVSRMVSIKASHQLSDRMSWSNMSLLVVSGRGKLMMGDTISELLPKKTLQILPHCEHQIQATTDLRLIVTFDAACIS